MGRTILAPILAFGDENWHGEFSHMFAQYLGPTALPIGEIEHDSVDKKC